MYERILILKPKNNIIMNNSIKTNLEDITTIDLDKYDSKLKKEIDKQKAKCDDGWCSLYANSATYEFIHKQINTYPLTEAKEFVNYCNTLLSQKKFVLHEFLRFGEVEKLDLSSSNSGKLLIYRNGEPIVWGLEEPIVNKYGFFKTSKSIDNSIEGIYVESLSGKTQIPLCSLIMTDECYNALLPD